jgi:hypothetical protein
MEMAALRPSLAASRYASVTVGAFSDGSSRPRRLPDYPNGARPIFTPPADLGTLQVVAYALPAGCG